MCVRIREIPWIRERHTSFWEAQKMGWVSVARLLFTEAEGVQLHTGKTQIRKTQTF